MSTLNIKKKTFEKYSSSLHQPSKSALRCERMDTGTVCLPPDWLQWILKLLIAEEVTFSLAHHTKL